MADKTPNQQKQGTGTADYEHEKGGQQQHKEQGKTGQHGGSDQQHDQSKREHSKGTPHNK